MKLRKLAALCARSKRIQVYERETSGGVAQFVGDGVACYLLDGLPYLTEEQLLTLFDVPDTKRDDYRVDVAPVPPGFCFEDTWPGEEPLEVMDVSLAYGGEGMLCIHTIRGLRFVNVIHPHVLADEKPLEVYQRQAADGRVYFALKVGMLLRGVILPPDDMPESLVQKLEGIAAGARQALEGK